MTSTLAPAVLTSGQPSEFAVAGLTAASVRISRRIEIYESDGTTLSSVANHGTRLIDGSITVDRDRSERRMADFTLDNLDKEVSLDPWKFWYDKVLKAYWGFAFRNQYGQLERYECAVGEFLIDRFSDARFPNQVKLSCRDFTKRCLNSKIKSSLQFAVGVPVEEIISSVAANAGIVKMQLPFTGLAYSRQITFDRGTPRWDIISQVADSVGYDAYFRGDGYLTMRRKPDPTYDAVRWTFQSTSAQASLVDFSRQSDDTEIFNSVTVVGTAQTDGAGTSLSVVATAENRDPGSPACIQRLGEKNNIIDSDLFTDMASAQAYANQLITIAALQQYDVSFESLIIPWLEPGDVVIIEDEDETTPPRFLLTSYSFPLGLGTSSGTAKRTTLVDFDKDWKDDRPVDPDPSVEVYGYGEYGYGGLGYGGHLDA